MGNSLDILIRKGSANTEFILHSVFQVMWNNFYFTPDTNFDSRNSFSAQFKDIKLSCQLAAPMSADFQFTTNDFNACIPNLHAIEKLIKHGKDEEVLSVVTQHLGSQQFKLSHALFKVLLL